MKVFFWTLAFGAMFLQTPTYLAQNSPMQFTGPVQFRGGIVEMQNGDAPINGSSGMDLVLYGERNSQSIVPTRFRRTFVGTSGFIGTQSAGGSSPLDLNLFCDVGANCRLWAGGLAVWEWTGGASIRPVADLSYDLGTTTQRVRDAFVGRGLVQTSSGVQGNPPSLQAKQYIRNDANFGGGAGNDCAVVWRLANGTEVLDIILVTDGNCP